MKPFFDVGLFFYPLNQTLQKKKVGDDDSVARDR